MFNPKPKQIFDVIFPDETKITEQCNYNNLKQTIEFCDHPKFDKLFQYIRDIYKTETLIPETIPDEEKITFIISEYKYKKLYKTYTLEKCRILSIGFRDWYPSEFAEVTLALDPKTITIQDFYEPEIDFGSNI